MRKISYDSFNKCLTESGRDDYVLVGQWNGTDIKTEFRDSDGFIHSITPYKLLNNKKGKLGMKSVIDKEAYLQFEIKDKLPGITIVGKYLGDKHKIEVEDELGRRYLCSPTHLKSGKTPTIRTAVSKNEWFMRTAENVHGNLYDYSKVDYSNATTKVEIVCKEHGSFLQTPDSHQRGNGCPECGKDSVGTWYYKNPDNWNKPSCCYLLRFKNEVEEFWKVGVTIDIVKRVQLLRRESQNKYNIEVQDIVYDTVYNCYYNLEKPKLSKIKSLGLEYKPAVSFGGETECFIGGSINTRLINTIN